MKSETKFPLRTGTRTFRSLEAFRKFGRKNGCRVKLVTKGKQNSYYQMIHPKQGIVGFFNTAFGGAVR